MKKIMFALTLVAAVATMATSCKKEKKTDPTPDPTPAKVDTLAVDFAAYADEYADYGDYQLILFDSETEAPYVIIDVLPTTASFVGTFSSKDETIDLDYSSVYLNAEDTASIEITSIEATVAQNADNSYEVNATIVSGEKTYVLSYKGDFVDYYYMYESTEVVTKEATFDVAEAEDYTAYIDWGAGLYLYLGENYECGLNILIDSIDSTTIVPVGTYKIDASGELGTCTASTGYSYYGADPTYFYTVDGEYIDEIWFIVDGTVTVTKEDEEGTVKVVVDGKSYNGSTIKVTYTGKIELASDVESAPAAKAARKVARKMVRK